MIASQSSNNFGSIETLRLLINSAADPFDKKIKVNYIDSGVPHVVIFVQGLDKLDVGSIGQAVRYHERFKPRGANVDFVEIIDDKNIRMRTYERGVEGETLACGTGAVASAIISNLQQGTKDNVNVHVKGGVLKVYFKNKKSEYRRSIKIQDVLDLILDHIGLKLNDPGVILKGITEEDEKLDNQKNKEIHNKNS